jgi:hypothetical protein
MAASLLVMHGALECEEMYVMTRCPGGQAL